MKDRKKSSGTVGPKAIRDLFNSELKILRGIAEKSGSKERLAVVDFMKANEDHLFGVLAITIETSAAFAAADGLSEKHWLQQILSRHASNPGHLGTLWQILVNLRRGSWPWPEESTVHKRAA